LISSKDGGNYTLSTCTGKWTLLYTDASDITSLARTPTALLGRVGQEIVKVEGEEYEVR